MLRNRIFDDFSGEGVYPPLDPPMSCLFFMGWHEKAISVNSSLLLIAIAYANMAYKIGLDLGHSLNKFKLSMPHSFIKVRTPFYTPPLKCYTLRCLSVRPSVLTISDR